MTEQEKAKLAAAGKMAIGVGQMGGAILTATGHGLIGNFLKQHHMTRLGMHLGKKGVEAGQRTLKDGLAAWKRADGE